MKFLRRPAAALLLAFSFLLASCADITAPAPEAAPPVQQVETNAELLDFLNNVLKKTLYLQCTPLPRAEVSQWVGPNGGTINVGPHRLVIPARALDRMTRITAVAPTGTVNRVQLYPHGLEFDRDAKLSLSYKNCSLLAQLLPRHIAYTTSDLRPLELLNAVPNLLRRETTADLEHFSDYVLAW